jgi:hypothetical protein
MPITHEKKQIAIKYCAMMDKLMKCYYENNSIEDYEKMENELHEKQVGKISIDEETGEDIEEYEPSIYDFQRNRCDMDEIGNKVVPMIRCCNCDCVVTKKGLAEHQRTQKCKEIHETKKFQHAQTNLKTADKLIEEKWDGNKLNVEKVSYDSVTLNTASGLRRIIDVFRRICVVKRINGKPKCVFRPKSKTEIKRIVARNCKNAVKKMKKAFKLIQVEEQNKIREEKKAVALQNKLERERRSIAFQEKKRLKEQNK